MRRKWRDGEMPDTFPNVAAMRTCVLRSSSTGLCWQCPVCGDAIASGAIDKAQCLDAHTPAGPGTCAQCGRGCDPDYQLCDECQAIADETDEASRMSWKETRLLMVAFEV